MNSTLWLASASPRRRELLTLAGYTLDVHPADIAELRHDGEPPISFALRMAIEKSAGAPTQRIVVAADTVVHLGDIILGKPVDREQAVAHLAALSNRWHQVTTGVCVRLEDQQAAFTVTTRVRFRELSEHELQAYVSTGDADDKAGAYGIQGLGGALIAKVDGSWTTVVGLPLEETIDALRTVAGDTLEATRGRC